jgi:hypothetical protein
VKGKREEEGIRLVKDGDWLKMVSFMGNTEDVGEERTE